MHSHVDQLYLNEPSDIGKLSNIDSISNLNIKTVPSKRDIQKVYDTANSKKHLRRHLQTKQSNTISRVLKKPNIPKPANRRMRKDNRDLTEGDVLIGMIDQNFKKI